MGVQIGYAEVSGRISLVGDSQEMAFTFGVQVVTPPFSQTSANSISQRAGVFAKAVMGSAYTYLGARFVVGNDGGGLSYESTAGTGLGTQGAASTPQNVAMLFKKNTVVGGRRNRGRMFLPGISEADVTNSGGVSAVAVALYNTAADTFTNGLVTDGFPMVILHPAVPAVSKAIQRPALAAMTPTAVSTLRCAELVATQRRRLR